MMLKTLLSWLLALPLLVVSGCTGTGLELVVGKYTSEESIAFTENKIVSEDKIEEFRRVVEDSQPYEFEVSDLADYVVTINNANESTMELMVNLWIVDAETIIFSRGIHDSDFFKINEDELQIVNDIINQK